MIMTIGPSDFPNGHGQNYHFEHDHNTIFIIEWFMVKWSKLTDISTISTIKKSGIVEMIKIKFGLNILTKKVLQSLGWSWSKNRDYCTPQLVACIVPHGLTSIFKNQRTFAICSYS
jgi:hypothetical protein